MAGFLPGIPFPNGLTDGLFYREKMRAIHRVAPVEIGRAWAGLEIGGGRSGLASILYPEAEIVTLDIDPNWATISRLGEIDLRLRRCLCLAVRRRQFRCRDPVRRA